MNLTTEQIELLRSGRPIRVVSEELGSDCIVMQVDVYDCIKHLLAPNDDLDPRESYPAVLKAWDEEGCPEDSELYRPRHCDAVMS